MPRDAFSAGVEPGGLYSRDEIGLLICYMLTGVDQPLPRQDVLDILVGGGMANLFEAGDVIDALVTHGSVTESGGVLAVSETGRTAAETLRSRIPYVLRDRSVKAAVQLLARRRSESETDITIEELPGGGCYVTCAIRDLNRPLMSVSLRVADAAQAQFVREQFLTNPSLIYRSLIAMLTGGAGVYREDKRIVIDLP
ncbi:MAG: DUF4364 family protein [Oscillospiraceae bacterium]|nr:DUF4364 family protein [Oscillospiraceae bacterium]